MGKTRGFEIVSTYDEKDVNLPKRSTKFSAGYDFESTQDVVLAPGDEAKVKTGVKAYMQPDEVLKIYNRSSNGGRGLILKNSVGIIDADYYNNEKNEGEIVFWLQNTSDVEIHISKGERIGQGIFQKFLTIDDEPEITNKRTGGFGSTNGITMFTVAITVIVLIILSTVGAIYATKTIERATLNRYISEIRMVQNALIREKSSEDIVGKAHKAIGTNISNETFTEYKQYLDDVTKDDYVLLKAGDLEKIGLTKYKKDMEYIANLKTLEVLSINPVKYNNVLIKLNYK